MIPCISVDPIPANLFILHACPTWAFFRCLPARGPRVPVLSCHTYVTLRCSPFLRPLMRIKVRMHPVRLGKKESLARSKLGMAIQIWVFDTYRVPDRYGYGDNFLPVGGIRTRPEPRWVRNKYFFPSDGYLILYYRYNSSL
jgi:hypothetical protein